MPSDGRAKGFDEHRPSGSPDVLTESRSTPPEVRVYSVVDIINGETRNGGTVRGITQWVTEADHRAEVDRLRQERDSFHAIAEQRCDEKEAAEQAHQHLLELLRGERAVEVMARAMHRLQYAKHDYHWDQGTDAHRDYWREQARAARDALLTELDTQPEGKTE